MTDSQTADRTDFAAPFRRDLGRFPGRVVLVSARVHLANLRDLDERTPDKGKAIADMEAFLKENYNMANSQTAFCCDGMRVNSTFMLHRNMPTLAIVLTC